MKGYVCPRCRLLLSASFEIVGEEVACPGCSSRIRVPGLYESVAAVGFTALDHSEPAQAYQNISPDNWQDDLPKELLALQSKGLPWNMLLPAFVVGACLLAGLIFLLFSTKVPPAERSQLAVRPVMAAQDQVTTDSAAPATSDVKALLDKLSRVKSLEEIEPFLRDVPELQAKLSNYYKSGVVSFGQPVDVVGVKEVRGKPGFYLFRSLLEGGVRKAGVVMRGANENWVIDWESYVGYCDVVWDDLPKLQPKQPSLVRAVRVKNEYYNQGFSSNEWQSFELTYPDSDTILVGYARKNDALMHQLLPIGNSYGAMEVTLKIHYPEIVNDKRLVIIDEVVAGHWVVTKTK